MPTFIIVDNAVDPPRREDHLPLQLSNRIMHIRITNAEFRTPVDDSLGRQVLDIWFVVLDRAFCWPPLEPLVFFYKPVLWSAPLFPEAGSSIRWIVPARSRPRVVYKLQSLPRKLVLHLLTDSGILGGARYEQPRTVTFLLISSRSTSRQLIRGQ